MECASSGSQDPNCSNLTSQTAFPTFVCSQLLCLDPLGLIQYIYCSRPHLMLWYLVGSYHSCHQDLLLQSLRVCHTISHYDSNILAAIVHLSVSVLYHQTLGQ